MNASVNMCKNRDCVLQASSVDSCRVGFYSSAHFAREDEFVCLHILRKQIKKTK